MSTTTPTGWTTTQDNGKAKFTRDEGGGAVYCPSKKWVVEIGGEVVPRRYFGEPTAAIAAAEKILAMLAPKPAKAKGAKKAAPATAPGDLRYPAVAPDQDPEFGKLVGWEFDGDDVVGAHGRLEKTPTGGAWRALLPDDEPLRGPGGGARTFTLPSAAARALESAAA